MLAPLVIFAFYIWYPLVYGIVLSFADTKGFNIVGFAGFSNYEWIFNDPAFVRSIGNGFVYVFWSLLIGFVIPIVLAVIINEIIQFKSFFRIALYFPTIVPVIATIIMWKFFMDPGEGGVLNSLAISMGAPTFGYLQEEWATIPLIILTLTWKSAGATTLIYIARLKGISQELYEAAEMDGAGIWHRFVHITMPQILNLGRLLLILQVLAVFQLLVEPMIMTGGGPNNASTSMLLVNYYYAFRDFRIGQAGAVGVIVNLILVALTFIYLRSTKENETN